MQTSHSTTDSRDRGRDAFRRQSWGDAYAHLSAADKASPLDPEDLQELAAAAHLIGRDDDGIELLTRAHNGYLACGNAARAARMAFWLAFALMFSNERSRAAGWVARARRLLDDGHHDCVERGYLLLPVAIRTLFEGDAAGALATFSEAATFGERFRDTDLITMARHGQGRSLIRLDRAAEGIALLDEVMVSVTAGEVSPIVASDVYCSVIEACHEIFDLGRAQEWTAALSQWCASQPEPVPYRGPCLLRRAEIMQLHGEWSDALDEAEQARQRIPPSSSPGLVGAALYQLAELHRLRGDFAEAEDAYRESSQSGRSSQPGLALLRLAQGQVDAASASIRRAMDEVQERRIRCRVLAAYVEIVLTARDVPAARTAADELAAVAAVVDAPILRAMSAQATGAVLLAEGDARASLAALRRAWTWWRDLEAPYEAARVRVSVGLACRALGDDDTAEMELDAARRVFQQLGAVPDVERVDLLSRADPVRLPGGLTSREGQVLALIASGKTNRAIADALVISEKTVARHVSNIFTKLGLANRSAATAYAYQHDLVSPRTEHRPAAPRA